MRSTALRRSFGLRALPVLLAASLGFSSPSAAATCLVDPTGGSGVPGAFLGVNAAIAGGSCGTPGSVIEIWCPAAGCSDRDVLLSGLANVTIRSQESRVPGAGPVGVMATLPAAALRVEASSNVAVEGIDLYQSGVNAIEIVDSIVVFEGLTAASPPRYSQVRGQRGMAVGGASKVTIHGLGFNDSNVGLRIAATLSGEPTVAASAVAFLRNGRAIDVTGPAQGCTGTPGTGLVLGGDSSVAWLNYVMENVEGIHLHGRSYALVDHTVFASNLTQMAPGGVNPWLLAVLDSAVFDARNVLIYDNDQGASLTPPYNGGIPAGIGSVLEHDSCAHSTFQASTVVNNGADIVFGVGGSGQVNLDHTVVAGNWGKTLSMSGWYVAHGNTCPPLGMSAAYFWNDRIYADPAVCLPAAPGLRLAWNPKPMVSASTPRTLGGYPAIPPPWTDLYWIRLRSPLPTALPTGLYVGRPWSVNGKQADKRRLDVGYHNPR